MLLEIGGSSKYEKSAKDHEAQDSVHGFYEHSQADADFQTPERPRSTESARTPIDIYMSSGSLKERREADLQRRKSFLQSLSIPEAGAKKSGANLSSTSDSLDLHEQQDPEMLQQITSDKLHSEWAKKFTEVETEEEVEKIIERTLILKQRLALRRRKAQDLLFLNDAAGAKFHLGLKLDQPTSDANPLHAHVRGGGASKEDLIDEFLQDTATPQVPSRQKRTPPPRKSKAPSDRGQPLHGEPNTKFHATCPEAAPSLEFSLWGESEAGAGEGPGPQSAPGAPPTAAPKRNLTRFVEAEAASEVAEPPRTPTASGAQPVPFSSPPVSIEQVYVGVKGAGCSAMPRPPRPRPRSRRLDPPVLDTGTGHQPTRGSVSQRRAIRMPGEESGGVAEPESPLFLMHETKNIVHL